MIKSPKGFKVDLDTNVWIASIRMSNLYVERPFSYRVSALSVLNHAKNIKQQVHKNSKLPQSPEIGGSVAYTNEQFYLISKRVDFFLNWVHFF